MAEYLDPLPVVTPQQDQQGTAQAAQSRSSASRTCPHRARLRADGRRNSCELLKTREAVLPLALKSERKRC
eukprot:1947119-Rhodomonas_salina.2